VAILATAAYSDGAPAIWRADVPDLSAAGYDALWGMRGGAGVSWEISALGGDFLPLAGARPLDRALMVGAGAVNGSPTVFNRRFRWQGVR
jgi:hypothetical protein